MSETVGSTQGQASELRSHPTTSQVSLGPVAQLLSDRRPRQRTWVPKCLLAFCTIGCGFIVHTAIENSPLTSAGPNESLAQPAHVVTAPIRNLDKERNSQVRSVIELVGAFEHLDHEEAEDRNPLALPADSPTAPVAFYSPTVPSSTSTDSFLEKINMKPLEESTEQTDAQMELVAVEAGFTVESAAGERQSVEVVDSVVDSVVARNAEPLKLALDARLSMPLPSAVPLPPTEITPVVMARRTESDLAVVASSDSDSLDEQSKVIHQVSHAQFEAIDHPAIDHPAVEPPEEIRIAVQTYDDALAAMQNNADRTASRKFYAALAELGQATRTHDSEIGRQRIREIYGKPQLFALTSSAAASWMRWPKRSSSGIVVAGKIESISEYSGGYLVAVRTTDRKSSSLSVFVSDVDFDIDSTVEAVFFGVIAASSGSEGSIVQGEFLGFSG